MHDATGELLARNEEFIRARDDAMRPAPPSLRLAVVACMDARLDVYRALGLREGEAHVIRNAGGVVTPDTIRSLTISQRLLGTQEIVLIHHTGCGMLGLSDDAFRREIERETGMRPEWPAEGFDDLDADVRQSIARIESSAFIPHKHSIRGFVFELESGRLREVERG